jgi:hypothetical protein
VGVGTCLANTCVLLCVVVIQGGQCIHVCHRHAPTANQQAALGHAVFGAAVSTVQLPGGLLQVSLRCGGDFVRQHVGKGLGQLWGRQEGLIHVNFQPMVAAGWGNTVDPGKTLADAYDMFLELRKRGVRAHSWV